MGLVEPASLTEPHQLALLAVGLVLRVSLLPLERAGRVMFWLKVWPMVPGSKGSRRISDAGMGTPLSVAVMV